MLNFILQKLYSGDSWKWTESLTGYSAQNYTLKIIIKYQANPSIELAASASNDAFSFNINSTVTNIPSGLYNYQAKLINKATSEVLTYEEGTVSILANLSSNQDPRESWRVIYDNLMEVYRKLSMRETEVAEYNGRKFTYRNMLELRNLIDDAAINAGIIDPIPVIREVY